jgi:hypothetical protein
MIEIGPNLLKAVEAVSVCIILAGFAIMIYKMVKQV